ncbi:hypothetical protein ANANG_G00191420 [Anguilla anguilla]|uniref:Protein CUSTOS n=1 Tax=Anguilla anguilla TaxID=7936 RepID=A0A9D3M169_ANGAN|nr:hypothetical protein ANANG_G00191420 [Anguilla anguilla]
MAASRGTVLEENSSSEDEDQEKFKEAAWSFGPAATNATRQNNSGVDVNDKPSRRVSVSQHDHDGNELETTPEFRAHVAKKLVAMLDSCISESTSPETVDTSTVLPAQGKDDEEEDVMEEGFRLFSTSVPGLSAKQPSPPPPPRRPIPSSSDSDSEMEMRLREAAISVTDLLPPSLLPSMPQSLASPAPPSAEKKKKKKKKRESEGRAGVVEGEMENGSLETNKKTKRKLTKGGAQESEMKTNSVTVPRSKKMAEHGSTEDEIDSAQQPEEATVKKKKKKKKKKSAGEGEG